MVSEVKLEKGNSRFGKRFLGHVEVMGPLHLFLGLIKIQSDFHLIGSKSEFLRGGYWGYSY